MDMTPRPGIAAVHIPGDRLLQAPGPTHLHYEVLNAMHRQPLDHGDPRLDALIATCEAGLKRVLQTAQSDVFMFVGNGHGAWEATIENLLPPEGTALIPGTGHFSEQWAIQTEGLGRHVVRTPWNEGYPIDPQAVEDALRADTQRAIAAVFVVHTDTSSGITSDVAALRAAIDAAGHPALLAVDVVASLGAAPFAMDALGANVTVGASQKGLMSPPGLAFVGVDALAMEAAARNPARRFYWDWARRKSDIGYRKFCGTAPQNLMYGLEAALGLIEREGIAAVFARHALLSRVVQAAVEAWSAEGALSFHCKVASARSASVTTIDVRPGLDIEAMRTIARERFQVAFAGALGPLAGRAFRIAHLGDQNAAMVLGCLGGIEAAMIVQGIPFGRDGVRQAVACLARG